VVVVQNLKKSLVEGKTEFNYSYRIIKNDFFIRLKSGTISVQVYGIEAEREDYKNEELINIERESIEYISPHRHKVQELLKTLYENTVSPIHLIDVLGEHIDEYVIDFEDSKGNIQSL